jgi:hypothetical protein
VLVDLTLVRLDRSRIGDGRLHLPVAGAIFAGLVSSAHLVALHLDGGIRWPVELWTGVVVSTVAIAALLGGLAGRPRASWVRL